MSSPTISLNLLVKGKKKTTKIHEEPLNITIDANISHFAPTTKEYVYPGIGATISLSFVAYGPLLLATSLSSSDASICSGALNDLKRLSTSAHRSYLTTYFKEPQLPENLLKLTRKYTKSAKHGLNSDVTQCIEETWPALFETANLSILDRLLPQLPSQFLDTIVHSKKKCFSGNLAAKSRLLNTLTLVSSVRSSAVILPSLCEILSIAVDQLIEDGKEGSRDKANFTATIMRVIITFDPILRPWLHKEAKIIDIGVKVIQSYKILESLVVLQTLELFKFFGSEFIPVLESLKMPSITYEICINSSDHITQDACRSIIVQMWPNSKESASMWNLMLAQFTAQTDERHRSKLAEKIFDIFQERLADHEARLNTVITLLKPHENTFQPFNMNLVKRLIPLIQLTITEIMNTNFFQTLSYVLKSCKDSELITELIKFWFNVRPDWSLRSRKTDPNTRPNKLANCFTDRFTSQKHCYGSSSYPPHKQATFEREESILIETDFFNNFLYCATVIPSSTRIYSLLWHSTTLLQHVVSKDPLYLHKAVELEINRSDPDKDTFSAPTIVLLQTLLFEVDTDDKFEFKDLRPIIAPIQTDGSSSINSNKMLISAYNGHILELTSRYQEVGEPWLRPALKPLLQLSIDLPIGMMAYRTLLYCINYEKSYLQPLVDRISSLQGTVDSNQELGDVSLEDKYAHFGSSLPETDDVATLKKNLKVAESIFHDFITYTWLLILISLSLRSAEEDTTSILAPFGALVDRTLSKRFSPLWVALASAPWGEHVDNAFELPIDTTLYPSPHPDTPQLNCGPTSWELAVVLRNMLTFWRYSVPKTENDSSDVSNNFASVLKRLLQLFGEDIGVACACQLSDLTNDFSQAQLPLNDALSTATLKVIANVDKLRAKRKGETSDEYSSLEWYHTTDAIHFIQPKSLFSLLEGVIRNMVELQSRTLSAFKQRFAVLRSLMENISKLRFYLLLGSVPSDACDPRWSAQYEALQSKLATWSLAEIESNWETVQPLLDAYYIPHLLIAKPVLQPFFNNLAKWGIGPVFDRSAVIDKGKDQAHIDVVSLKILAEIYLDVLIVLPTPPQQEFASRPIAFFAAYLRTPDENLVNRASWLLLRYYMVDVGEFNDFIKADWDLLIRQHHNLLCYPIAFKCVAHVMTLFAQRIVAFRNHMLPITQPIAAITSAFWYYHKHLEQLLASCNDPDRLANWFERLSTRVRKSMKEGRQMSLSGRESIVSPRPMLHMCVLPAKKSTEEYQMMEKDWIANQRTNMISTTEFFAYIDRTRSSFLLFEVIANLTPAWHGFSEFNRTANFIRLSEHAVHDALPQKRRTLNRKDKSLLELMDSSLWQAGQLIHLENTCTRVSELIHPAISALGLKDLHVEVSYPNHLVDWISSNLEEGEDVDRLAIATMMEKRQESLRRKKLEEEKEKRKLARTEKNKAYKKSRKFTESDSASLSYTSSETTESESSEYELSMSDCSSYSSSCSDDDDDDDGSDLDEYTESSSIPPQSPPQSLPSDLEKLEDAVNANFDEPHMLLMKNTAITQLMTVLEALLELAVPIAEFSLQNINFSDSAARSMSCNKNAARASEQRWPFDSWLLLLPILLGTSPKDMNDFEPFDPSYFKIQDQVPLSLYWKWLHLMAAVSPKLPQLYRATCAQLTFILMQKDIQEQLELHNELRGTIYFVIAEFGYCSCNPRVNPVAPHMLPPNDSQTSSSPQDFAQGSSKSDQTSDAPSAGSTKLNSVIVDPSIAYKDKNEMAKEHVSALRRMDLKDSEGDSKPSDRFYFDDLDSVPSYIIHYLPLLLDAIYETRAHEIDYIHVKLLRILPRFVPPRCTSQLFELAQFAIDYHNIALPRFKGVQYILPSTDDFGKILATVVTTPATFERFFRLMPLVDRPIVVHTIGYLPEDDKRSLRAIEVKVEPVGGARFLCENPPLWTFAALIRAASPDFINSNFHKSDELLRTMGIIFSLIAGLEAETRACYLEYLQRLDLRSYMMMLPLIPHLLTYWMENEEETLLMQENEKERLARVPHRSNEAARASLTPSPFFLQHPTCFIAWDKNPFLLAATLISHPTSLAERSLIDWSSNCAYITHGNGNTARWSNIHALDRKLRLRASAVQQLVKKRQYSSAWYPKGFRAPIAEDDLPMTIRNWGKSTKNSATAASSRMASNPLYGHNNDQYEDAAFQAAVRESLRTAAEDAKRNLSQSSASPARSDEYARSTIASASLVYVNESAEHTMLAILTSLCNREDAASQLAFLTQCSVTEFAYWLCNEMGFFIDTTELFWTNLTQHLQAGFKCVALHPPPQMYATSMVWHFESEWNYGMHKLRVEKMNGLPTIGTKVMIPVIDRVITTWFTDNIVTLPFGAPSVTVKEKEVKSKKSGRKVKSKKKKKKGDDTLNEDESAVAEKEANNDEKAALDQSKWKSSFSPMTPYSFWISPPIVDQREVRDRYMPFVRVGYATKEALEMLEKEPLKGIGDVPGSWAIDSMTGIILSEGSIVAHSTPTSNQLLSKAQNNEFLVHLFYEAYSNEIVVSGLLAPPRVMNAEGSNYYIPLPYAKSASESVQLYPCISFYENRSVAVYKGKRAIENQ